MAVIWQSYLHIHHTAASTLAVKLIPDKCHRTSPMRSQHCLRKQLGVVRQQAITWANVGPGLCRLVAPLDHIELMKDASVTRTLDAWLVNILDTSNIGTLVLEYRCFLTLITYQNACRCASWYVWRIWHNLHRSTLVPSWGTVGRTWVVVSSTYGRGDTYVVWLFGDILSNPQPESSTDWLDSAILLISELTKPSDLSRVN